MSKQTKSRYNNEKDENDIPQKVSEEIASLIRKVGYFFLGFSLFIFLKTLIPVHLFDSQWEFSVIGQLVDQIWWILLGFVFIFYYREGSLISYSEARLLNFFSWLSLVVAISYLVMIPLSIYDTSNISYYINNDHILQDSKIDTQLERLDKRIQQSNSPEQLIAIAKRINPQKTLSNTKNLDQLKQEIKAPLEKLRQNLHKNNADQFNERLVQFSKTGISTIFGSILSATSLYVLWRSTLWARLLFKQYQED